MTGLLIGFITVLVAMLGFGTYIRNMVWAVKKTLWEDTIEKASGRAKAYQISMGELQWLVAIGMIALVIAEILKDQSNSDIGIGGHLWRIIL